jgi:hypothetical protein
MFATKAQKDNWGDPSLSTRSSPSSSSSPPPPPPPPPPYALSGYYEKQIRVPCQEQWKMNEKPMSELLPSATVIYSSNTLKYDNFESIDWIPENKDLYSNGAPWGSKFDFPSKKKKSILASTCHLNEDEIHQWELTRIGPFITTGGSDWIQIGWEDVWELSKVLDLYPQGIFVMKQFLSPVLKDGTRIPSPSHHPPPLRVHHMHVGPSPYVRQRSNPVDCVLRGRGCWNPVTVIEYHDDGNDCLQEGEGEVGYDCYLEHYPTG